MNYDPYVNPQTGYFYQPQPAHKSTSQFFAWMQKTAPTLYTRLKNERPELVSIRSNGLAGLNEVSVTGSSGYGEASGAETNWGQSIANFVQTVMPAYYQNQIFQTNLSRAEKGLPPIDPGSIAPTVKVGLTGDTAQLGYFALAGLVVFGLYSLSKRH